MDIKRIWAVYFSPTGGTKKAVTAIAGGLSEELGLELQGDRFYAARKAGKKYMRSAMRIWRSSERQCMQGVCPTSFFRMWSGVLRLPELMRFLSACMETEALTTVSWS